MATFPKLGVRQIDYLNIGLMFVALVLAFILPFEVFLFSYAVLGPLHYLTEISWLHQKNYYMPQGKSLLWIFPLLASLLTIFLILDSWSPWFSKSPQIYFRQWSTNIIFFLFGLSGILVILQKKWQRIISIGVLSIVCLSLNLNTTCVTCTNNHGNEKSLCTTDNKATTNFVKLNGKDINNDGMITSEDNCKTQQPYRSMVLLFGAYIPSLIHVYLFTMLFMLFGALKNNSKIGYVSVIVLIICGLIPFIWNPSFLNYNLSDQIRKIYDVTFLPMNQTVFATFGLGSTQPENVYSSNIGIMLTRFIAFAYTYHYLNWFSKTSIIQWHKVPMLNLGIVLVLWIISIVLYAIDYRTGFTALLFLSFLHVFVEFPLNFQSFIGIGKGFAGKLKVQSA